MLFIQEKKPELNTRSDSIKQNYLVPTVIITPYVSRCSAFNYMQRDFHTHS